MMELRALEAEFRARMHKTLKFDRVDDYINCGTGLNTIREFTVLAWIKIFDYPSAASYGILTLGSGGNTHGFRFRVDWTKKLWLLMARKGKYTTWTSDVDVPLNKWTFVGVTGIPEQQVQLIVDDVIKTIDTTQGMSQPTGNTLVGSSWNAIVELFKGLISLVYFYDIVLSKSEIKYIYNNPFDPPEIEHLALWLTPAGIDIANGKWWDLSGRNNHGTIYGCTEVLLTEPEVAVV